MANLNSRVNYLRNLLGMERREVKSFFKTAHKTVARRHTQNTAAWFMGVQFRKIDKAKVERDLERLLKLQPRPLYISAPPLGQKGGFISGPAYRTEDGYVTADGKKTV